MNNTFFQQNKYLLYILTFGLFLRMFFLLFGAEYYFGRENIFVGGDTSAWRIAFMNLITHGSYSVNLEHELGYFGRMPGYSFFMGIFYFLTGKKWDLAYPVIGWVQTFLDVLNIYFIYKITLNVFKSNYVALISAFLYATYPFIIVWNPVVYSEQISIFFMLLGLYFFTKEPLRNNLLIAGAFIALAILNRPQIALLTPSILIYIVIFNNYSVKKIVKQSLFFLLPIVLIYGSWPIRNYVNHKKIIPTQHLGGFNNWDEDVISYLNYIYSVKAEWEPQFSNIIKNKPVKFPRNAYTSKEDSVLLEKAIYLSKNCGSGFSYWQGYWKETIEGENCNKEIAKIYTQLRKNQIKKHPFNFYINIPLQNLYKALFKFKQNNTSSYKMYIASSLFLYRTVLLILGLIGLYFMIKQGNKYAILFILNFTLLYGLLSFGTSTQFRNIEMRYFLPIDILMLIPLSFMIGKIRTKFIKYNG